MPTTAELAGNFSDISSQITLKVPANAPAGCTIVNNFYTFAQQSADPVGHFRFNNISLFAVDSWRALSKLSLELGIRYERSTPTYTQGNNMANFDPSLYSRSAAPTSITSSNVPIGG